MIRRFAALLLWAVPVWVLGASGARSEVAPTPSPSATATSLFAFSADLRAYYFGRTNGNTCFTCTHKGASDATAFNFGGELHGQLVIPRSAFSLGATYFGAYPFGANAPGMLNNVGYNPKVDNTLPGYALSIFGESYLQYKTRGTFFQTGREIITTPWVNAGDSRIAPEAFQGTLINGNVTPDLSLGAMYVARFRTRVTSAFNSNTLLTSCNTSVQQAADHTWSLRIFRILPLRRQRPVGQRQSIPDL